MYVEVDRLTHFKVVIQSDEEYTLQRRFIAQAGSLPGQVKTRDQMVSQTSSPFWRRLEKSMSNTNVSNVTVLKSKNLNTLS